MPNSEFLQEHLSHVLTKDGYIKVNSKLEVRGQENHYALGDVADVGEGKLGYLAQQQGVYLAKTIIKSFAGRSNKAYKRNPFMALIPIGQDRGVVQLPFAVTTMKLLVNLKQKDLFINKIYKSFGVR